MVAHEEVAQTMVAQLLRKIENCRIVIRSMLFKLRKIGRARNAAADFLAKYGANNKGHGEKVMYAPDVLLELVNRDKISYEKKTMVAEDAIMDMVTEEVVDWAELPHHMVELIMNKLMTPEISDYVRCGVVCTSWRTVFIDHHHHPPPHPRPVTLPFLIVRTPSSSSTSCSSNKMKRRVKTNNTKSLSFYNVIDKKVYNQFQVSIPGNRYFRGSSHGWLVAVDQNYNYCQVRLFNPFLSPSAPPTCSSSSSSSHVINAGEILLPSLKDISVVINKTIDGSRHVQADCVHHKYPSSYNVYLKKAVLSADPLSNPIDYIVMAILGSLGRLAYCRPGKGGCPNKAWSLVEFEYSNDWGFSDVIYYKGKFYALSGPGKVVVLDPTRNMMAVTLEIPQPRFRLSRRDKLYLVESGGILYQVYRKIKVGVQDILTERRPYSTTGFKVYVLQDETKEGNIYDIEKMNYQEQKEEKGYRGRQWKLLEGLSKNTFFLGDNHSISVRASDYPGLHPNSIYFTDDFINMYHCKKCNNGPHDLGVFNLVDGTIESHYPSDHVTPIWPVPIWIQPTVIAGIDLDPTINN